MAKLLKTGLSVRSRAKSGAPLCKYINTYLNYFESNTLFYLTLHAAYPFKLVANSRACELVPRRIMGSSQFANLVLLRGHACFKTLTSSDKRYDLYLVFT